MFLNHTRMLHASTYVKRTEIQKVWHLINMPHIKGEVDHTDFITH